MSIRKRSLPAGWYPSSPDELSVVFKEWEQERGRSQIEEDKRAAIVPHAGWGFSGKLAYKAIACLIRDIDTVVVAGGHMALNDGVVAVKEDQWEAPQGPLTVDKALLAEIEKNAPVRSDTQRDNTIEVQLPFATYFFKNAMILGVRVPPSSTAVKFAETLFSAAKKLGRRCVVIGSTDLTHYGPSYGFTPKGTGPEAVQWVKEENDKKMVDFMRTMDSGKAIKWANQNYAACSVGGAVTAIEWARRSGVSQGRLVGYYTSNDVYPGKSFVGYAGIVF